MSLRLLIADDHQLVREGMRSLLERTIDGLQVFEAKDGHCLLYTSPSPRD